MARAQFLARAPPSCCSPTWRASSSAEVFHTQSTFSESRGSPPPPPPKKRAAPPALHFCLLLCHPQLQNKELLTRLKPSSKSAKWVLQAGGRRGWTMAIPQQTRYQQPHRSPTRGIYLLSQQLHSVCILPLFQALLHTIFNYIQLSVCFHIAHAVCPFLVFKIGATYVWNQLLIILFLDFKNW